MRNVAIAVPLKYLSNFGRSLKMSMINCKVELKFRLTKYCVLSVGGTDVSGNDEDDNIIFTIEDTKLYVPVVTSSARDNQNLSKLLSKWFERSVYWNEFKTEKDNKNMLNKLRYFLESNFVGVNRLCFNLFKPRCHLKKI